MYESFDERRVLTEKPKKCKKGAQGINDLTFIDKMFLKEAKYMKAYNTVPHSWIMECLTIFKIANNVQDLLHMPCLSGKLN